LFLLCLCGSSISLNYFHPVAVYSLAKYSTNYRSLQEDSSRGKVECLLLSTWIILVKMERTILDIALKRAQQVLAILEGQAAGYTALTIPAHLQIELAEKRQEVASLEAQLQASSPPPPVFAISSLPTVGAIELFISYAHEDEALRDELAKHLSLLVNQGIIKAWCDRDISAGAEWDVAIKQRLNAAQIILLLVSADFLASPYIWSVELQRAMERHEAGEARVIPVILRPADWESAPFGKLQALPKDGKAVTTWANRDEAFADIVRGIRQLVNSFGN
jgi:hypothetical protein